MQINIGIKGFNNIYTYPLRDMYNNVIVNE
jgi:hypothetical protein